MDRQSDQRHQGRQQDQDPADRPRVRDPGHPVRVQELRGDRPLEGRAREQPGVGDHRVLLVGRRVQLRRGPRRQRVVRQRAAIALTFYLAPKERPSTSAPSRSTATSTRRPASASRTCRSTTATSTRPASTPSCRWSTRAATRPARSTQFMFPYGDVLYIARTEYPYGDTPGDPAGLEGDHAVLPGVAGALSERPPAQREPLEPAQVEARRPLERPGLARELGGDARERACSKAIRASSRDSGAPTHEVECRSRDREVRRLALDVEAPRLGEVRRVVVGRAYDEDAEDRVLRQVDAAESEPARRVVRTSMTTGERQRSTSSRKAGMRAGSARRRGSTSGCSSRATTPLPIRLVVVSLPATISSIAIVSTSSTG